MIAPAQADGVVTVSAANPLPANQAIVKPEAPTTKQKLNAQIKDFILKLAKDLSDCESNPKSNFYDRQHVLGAVAVVAFAKSGGLAAKAATETGILAANLLRQIETLQTRFELPGLLRVVSVPAVLKELGIAPEQTWPKELSFSGWSAKPIIFIPAPRPTSTNAASNSNGKAAAYGANTSASSSNAQDAAKLERGKRAAAEWLFEKVKTSYEVLKQFTQLSRETKGSDGDAAKVVPGSLGLKNSIFWQGFARCRGDPVALKKMFAKDGNFVEHQLALKAEKYGVPMDVKVYELAFEKKEPKVSPLIQPLPTVIELAEFEVRRAELETKLSGA